MRSRSSAHFSPESNHEDHEDHEESQKEAPAGVHALCSLPRQSSCPPFKAAPSAVIFVPRTFDFFASREASPTRGGRARARAATLVAASPRQVLRGEKHALDAAELAFEVAGAELERGGAAVGAVRRSLDEVSLGEEGLHLLGGEGVAGFDGGLAGHHVQGLVHVGLFAGGLVALGELVEQVGDEGVDVDVGEHRRERLHADRSGAEGGDFYAELGEEFVVLVGGLLLAGGDFDGLRDEQTLRLKGAGQKLLAETLVEDSLVEGVLVHDDDALVGLGDEVGVVDLDDAAGEAFEETGCG